MRIEIANRLHPFSHTPGTQALIPGSSWKVRACPTLLEFESLLTKDVFCVELALTGAMQNFTLVQDLEKRALIFFGSAKEGYVRLMITHRGQEIQLMAKRAPAKGLMVGKKLLMPKDVKTFKVADQGYLPPFVEKLALGCHKAQDVDLMHRRLDLVELLPFWFCLGQQTPSTPCAHKEGALKLLDPLAQCIEEREKLKIKDALLQLFSAGFTDVFVPRLVDEQHQGIIEEGQVSADLSPLSLLTEGAQLIRSLFFQQRDHALWFLPCLPPDFHAGRLINVHAQNLMTFDMEWSKKQIKKLVIRPEVDVTIQPHFQRGVKSYRLRHSMREKGQVRKCSDALELNKGQEVLVDHFEK